MPQPQPPRKQPKQARSRDLVTAIVEAAARVFEERGYEATTTNQIAEVAGVSVGSMYQYFADKQSLLTALHERHAADVLNVIESVRMSANERGLRASIALVVSGLLELHRVNPRLQRILHDEHSSLEYRKTDSVLGREILARTTELLGSYPELSLENPALTAQLLVRVVEDLVHAAVLDPPESGTKDEVERAIVQAAEAFVVARKTEP
jgi:AcrR family transcriptional regulator